MTDPSNSSTCGPGAGASTAEVCAIPIQGPDALYRARQYRHRLLLNQFEREPLGYRLRSVVVGQDATEESFLPEFLEPVVDCSRPHLCRLATAPLPRVERPPDLDTRLLGRGDSYLIQPDASDE